MKRRLLKGESIDEESPTQVQQRNIREAEMLTTNLGEGNISSMEILSDIGVLKELAILQESMEWFASRISDFASILRKPPSMNAGLANGVIGHSSDESGTSSPHPSSPQPPAVIKDGTIKVLTNLALEFEELANTCLLVLHLEVSSYLPRYWFMFLSGLKNVLGKSTVLPLSSTEYKKQHKQ